MRELPRLIAITPDDAPTRVRERFVTALRAGLPGVLVRQPTWSDREVLDLVEALSQTAPGAWIAVHDRAHLAFDARVAAVHLGFRSLPPEEARALVPPDRAVGFSGHAHDAPGARAGADYVFFGPVLATPSKAGVLEPVGFEGLAAACAASAVPVLALGGLAPGDVRACLEAGAHGVACLSGIGAAPDPESAVRAWLDALGEVRWAR